MKGVNVEKKEHHMWTSAKAANIEPMVGKWHYIYSNANGRISLVEFLDYFMDGKDFWEIYCGDGKLLDDIERYDTKKEAVNRIRGLLQ